ncbi:hypothetical protein MGWOODY_Smn1327 [hydrothermal vent metagenome]|jgi:hypothetical protein|uniref:Uncharacterized protein n=1 Tax=hydrothermal vent metagenome TaxID=652676 RepID=A0A170PMU5_9ZZZZ
MPFGARVQPFGVLQGVGSPHDCKFRNGAGIIADIAGVEQES